MRRFEAIEDLNGLESPLHLALGVFDGVHLGHQAVIGAVVEGARTSGGSAGVVTFEPHPVQVLAPERAPRRILATLAHKERVLAELGIEVLLVLPFTPALAKQPAEEFGKALIGLPALKQIAVGEDWRFGRDRAGDVAMLRTLGGERGVEISAVVPVTVAGERVSSTRIRQALREGDLGAAAALLGRPYTVLGTVRKGEQVGRGMGVPTANIEVGNEQLPPDGVYAMRALTDGTWWAGVANLGVRPTVGGENRLLEVHLFDFDGDLYGREVEVQFGQRLREEIKFGDLASLRKQIGEDLVKARRLFAEGAALNV